MKKIKYIIFSIVMGCVFVSYGSIFVNAKTIARDKITAKNVEVYCVENDENLKIFTINFSAITYEVNGKTIRIPMFRGAVGDVNYRDLLSYYQSLPEMSKIDLTEAGYIIKVKKGEAKKTLHEFLAFYKSNILKDVDIEHPVTIYLSPVEWILQYNFVVDGVPCYMHINFESRKEDYGKPLPKSVYDIVPNENAGNPGIFFMFYRGRSVPQ